MIETHTATAAGDGMPEESATAGSARRTAMSLLVFAAAYVAAAYVGRLTTFADTPFALIWPAAGVAVVWFLVRGAGIASIDAALLAACAFATNASTGVSVAQSVVLALTNVVQTWVAVVLLRRWCGELWGCGGTRALDSPRLTIRYVGALAGGMLVGVVVGVIGTYAVQNDLTLTRGVLWFDRNGFCILYKRLHGARFETPEPATPGRPVAMVEARALALMLRGIDKK